MEAQRRIEVEGSPTRCPYCKAGLDVPSALVACASCGARHHAECYAELGRCASCAATEKLVPEARARPSTRDVRGVALFGSFLIVAGLALAVLAFLAQAETPKLGRFVFLLTLSAGSLVAGIHAMRSSVGKAKSARAQTSASSAKP